MGMLSAFSPQLLEQVNRQKGGLLGLPIGQGGTIATPKMPAVSNAGTPRDVYQRFQGPGLLGALFAGANAAIDSDIYEKGLQQRQNQFLGTMQDPRDAIQEASRLGRTDWVDRIKQQQSTDQEAAQQQATMAARQQAAQMMQDGDYEGASRVLLGAGDVQAANAIWSGQENKAQATSARVKALGQTAGSLAQGLKGVSPEKRAEIVQQYANDLRELGATDDLLQDMASGDNQILDAIITRGMSANEYADNERADSKFEVEQRLANSRQALIQAQLDLTNARTSTERALASSKVREARAQATKAEQDARAGVAGRRGGGGSSGGNGYVPPPPPGFVIQGR